jgi:peptidyl-prolyl cis-trans isomerase C
MRFALPPCAAAAFLLAGAAATAQTPPPAPATTAAARSVAIPDNAVAARVNGQPILGLAVRRVLSDIPPDKQAEVREELLNQLIDNVLVEQYLLQMRVEVADQEVEKRLQEIRSQEKQQKKDLDEELKKRGVGLDELRGFIKADLRWEAFATKQTDEAKLKAYFDANKDMFDGSAVRARHILVTPPANDPKAEAEAVAKLKALKKQVETEVAAGLAKLPPTNDNLAREQARGRLTEESFGDLAKKESVCPSKDFGGDVRWFSRDGSMAEPFSRAAFACQTFQMTEPVKTQFGYHLILVTDRKPGTEHKYEEVKDRVKDIYGDKLREAVIAMMRQRAKIEITPLPKQ